MNSIFSIIATLSDEDKKKFVLELKQKNKRKDTKNVELFRILEESDGGKNVDIQLYGKSSKGAYHALSKRLHDTLVDFIAIKSFERESSEEMEVLKLLLAGRVLFERKQIKIAFKTLTKAELKAEKYSLYHILNEVYYTQIEYAHLNSSSVLKDLIVKYKRNKLNILNNENLNLFYASIHQELKDKGVSFSEVLNKNLVLFDISITENLSYQSLCKILEICNQVGHFTRDYYAVLPFIEKAYREIAVSNRIGDKHLYYHIQVLYFMSNAYFRIKEFELSMKYLEAMRSYIGLQDNKYNLVFYPQYLLLESLLYVYTGKVGLAVSNIKQFSFEKYKKQSVYLFDIKLTLVVALFFKEEFKEAFSVYKGFYKSDIWYAAENGNIWVVKKNLIEILILIELNHFDLVEARVKSFRKKYKSQLIEASEMRILEFLKLAEIYYYNKEEVSSEVFKKRVERLLIANKKEEDIFVISFYAWLIAKIEKKDIYQISLDFIDTKIWKGGEAVGRAVILELD